MEDEEQVRSLVVSQLTARGYAVLSAADGREALRIAEKRAERIDVLLADVVMPRMSGPELARLLARSHPETAVIFMSGYAEEAVLAQGALGAGGAFIGKPFEVDDAQRPDPASPGPEGPDPDGSRAAGQLAISVTQGRRGTMADHTDKRKQSLYFPEEMLREIEHEAQRLDRSLSWVVQHAWRLARGQMAKIPG